MFGKRQQIAKLTRLCRASLHGHNYRHRPNWLETLKTTHRSQENSRGASIRPCPNGRTYEKGWNEAYGKGQLRTGFAKLSSRRSVEEDAGSPSFTKKEDAAGGQPHLGEGLLLSVHGGLRTLLERLEVPDHAFASVVRELEILGEFKGVGRASIFAEAAEHATAQVVGEF
jgi:hypothetical protein